MRGYCRTFDWAATPLGPVEAWPQSLRTAATAVLGSGFPAVLLWGPELVQIYNDGYVPFLAVKHPWALGQATRDCWPEVWYINAPIYKRVAAGETIFLEDAYFPVQRQGPGGLSEDLYITLSYGPVSAEGESVGGVLVVLADTTAQVNGRSAQAARDALETELRGALLEASLVLDQVRDAYMLMDAAFNIVTVNQSAERVLGRSSADLVGRTHWDAFPASVGAEPERQYRRVLEEGVEVHFIHHYLGDGYDFDLEVDAYPASGGGIAVFWRDISERVRLLDRTERARAAADAARAEAEAANRSKSEFLAVMSHELRTPLNAIAGYVELIEMGIRGPVTEAQLIDLGRVRKSQRHLLGLINGVLDYAKVAAGAVRFDMADVALFEVLGSCEALVLPQARAKRIALRFTECDPMLAVRADREKLQQIVLNLLANAVKFTEPGGAVGLVCEGTTFADGAATGSGRVYIRVSDTGAGIAENQLERVFEPFVQVDAKLTRAHGGTGLGLAISRDLSRGMGGDLTVESTLGVGSTFTLELPAT